MDQFSYNNIFETKGIEYLIIITFLALIIPFWIILNRKDAIKRQIKRAFGVLSANILRIPKGLFYSRNHTWAHMEISGNATVGLDDLLLHITGEVNFNTLKSQGESIKKGDLLAEIDQYGKLLKIYSPLSGEIVGINPLLKENPGLMNKDPYGEGWIYRIRPSEWIAETGSYLMADEAIAWSKRELERFKDFLATSFNKYSPGSTQVILQDGGELSDNPLSELSDEVWQDFQKSFLNQP
jgi:glycine cleavage system H protein